MTKHFNPPKAINQAALARIPFDTITAIPLHRHNAKSKDRGGKVREDGKRPRDSAWSSRHYDSKAVIAECLKEGRNIGGRLPASVIVVDIDPRNGGDKGFQNLCADLFIDPEEFKDETSITGSGGRHIFLSNPTGVPVRDTAKHESDTKTEHRYAGVEFKSAGRQVVLPGSRHPNGKLYRWATDATGPLQLQPCPSGLLALIARPANAASVTSGGQITAEELGELLHDHLDPEDYDSNETWEPLMMACHHASGGQGRQEFIDWSTSDPKFADDADMIGRRWDSCDDKKAGARTYKTLNRILREAGKSEFQIRKANDEVLADFEELDEPDRIRAENLREIFADDAGLTEEDIEYRQDLEARNARAREAEAKLRSEHKEQRFTIPEICDQWVWVAPLKRFVNRENPTLAFDKEAFNDRFQYLKGDSSSLSKRLFGRTKDTIRKLNGMVYRPNAAEFTEDGMWNGWRPSLVKPVEGDTTLLEEHAAYLFPNDEERTLFLDWMAAVLQNPQTKPRHQIMLIGPNQGTGKTFWVRLMRALFGPSNCQALTQDILLNGFTGWAMRTKFVWIEEVRDAMNSKGATAKLHTWASEGTITINEKQLPTFVMDQAIAFMLMSNKRDAIAPDNTDRRYLTFLTEAKPKGGDYYDKLYGVNGVGGVLHTPALLSAAQHFFLNRKLQDGYSIERAAPFTSAKQALIDASGSEWQKWLLDNPPNNDVVCIADVINDMPKWLQRAGADNGVRNALRDRFGGVPWPNQIQPQGRTGAKIRVWLIGDTAKRAAKLTSHDVLTKYKAERPWMFQEEEEMEFG